MPMVINGGSRRAGSWWAKHLGNATKNERAELVELRGIAAENIREALREMEAQAIGTKCQNYFYQANINPRADETLTPPQWEQAVDTLERNLGFEGLPRFVVEHEKAGRIHRHVVWGRIDPDTRTARPDGLTAAIHEQTSRELESAFGLEPGRSVLTADRDFPRPERGPEKWAIFQGKESGIDPRSVKAQVTEIYRASDSAPAFVAGLAEHGYTLAQGDRRDFVVLDQAGHTHSLARRIEGVKAAELRDFMVGIDRAAIPTIDQARQQLADRAPAVTKPVRDLQREAYFASVAERQAERAAAQPANAVLEATAEIAARASEQLVDAGATVAGGVGKALGAAIRLAEAPIDFVIDFFTGGSAASQPAVSPAAAQPRPKTPAQRARELLRHMEPDVAAQDANARSVAATHTGSVDAELDAAMRRAREQAARNRDRDDDYERER